jgi:hypothetical protein
MYLYFYAVADLQESVRTTVVPVLEIAKYRLLRNWKKTTSHFLVKYTRMPLVNMYVRHNVTLQPVVNIRKVAIYLTIKCIL